MAYILIVIFLTLMVVPVYAVDYSLHYRASSEFYDENNGVFFQDSGEYLHQAVVDVDVEHQGFRSAISVIKQWQDEVSQENDKVILGELYLDADVLNWDVTLGKKRLNWGVGYAQQPLNIITTESKLATGIVVEEGAWLLSAERYTGTGSLTLIAANSETQQESNRPQPKGAGLRYYALVNDWDLQMLMYFDDIHEASIGGSAVVVIGEATTWHFSALWSKEYDELVHGLSAANPFPVHEPIQRQQGTDGVQLLAGVNVSFSSGVSVIAEYWYDGRSASRDQWDDLILAGRIQAMHANGAELLLAEQEFFTAANLMQHNIMLYLSYDSEYWDFRADIQVSPEDKGVVSTARFVRKWHNGHSAQIGFRTYGGSADSVYRQVPNTNEVFLRFEGIF